MGGLLEGPKGMLAPLSNYWGGPPPPSPLFLRLCHLKSFTETINTGTVVTANTGETAVLICPSSMNLSITFWAGPPGFTTYNSQTSTDIVYDDGTRLEINETNAVLLIHNVTLADEGIYRCFASGSGIADVQLVVTNST